MGLDGIGPVDPASGQSAAAPPPARPAEPGEFARLLRAHLAEPRSRIAGVRAAIDAIRDGAAIRPGGDAGAGIPSTASRLGPDQLGPDQLALFPYGAGRTSSGGDPFGWRSLTRRVGDELVGPGYGALFERQIQQESGFAPEVAFGLRQSSAGAEGIAQLMPEYYPGVDRTDPEASLVAAARTMRQYLTVFDGDVRKALASYNAGLGRVQSLVAAHGDDWERALPAETKLYLSAIVGGVEPWLPVESVDSVELAVFGGRGPGGVLTPPLDHVLDERAVGGLLDLLAIAGAAVRAPAGGRVIAVDEFDDGMAVVIDHGNGWQSSLRGLTGLLVAVGDDVRRSAPLGAVAEGLVAGQGRVRLGVTLDGRLLDAGRYLLRA